MTLKKMVNGVEMKCTPEEEAGLLADWQASDYAAGAQAAEAARKASIDAVIAADTTIQSLRAMTNAEFDTWWAANVTNLAQANNVLKRIARVVLRRVL